MRDARGRFVKGQSGNPGGRPATEREVRELALSYGRQAMERLVELMRSGDERVALAASVALLDRAVGKPRQAVELEGVEGIGGAQVVLYLPRNGREAPVLAEGSGI